MNVLNPLFNKNKDNKTKQPNTSNVRKQPITKVEGRKERCDKKKDVKIPFTEDERKLIKELSRKRNLDPTPYCSLLLKKGLKEKRFYPHCPYDPKGKPYPAKLEQHYHDLLFTFKVEWDCSLKESAYRIISYMLKEERRLLL